jgi:hypothetical protein
MILATHGIIASQITQFVGLLDLYPNAAAAYSLRKLRTAYTGSAIRVRRTDLDEMDIGFTSTGELDTTALLAFTGTGVLDNGFVETWYDQSGNAVNATQSVAINQPQIVSSGSVITANSKPTLRFDGVNDSLTLGTQTVGVSTYIQIVKRNGTSGGTFHTIAMGSTGGPLNFAQTYVQNANNNLQLYQNGNINFAQSFDTVLQAFQTYLDTTGRNYKNNVLGTTGSLTFTSETGNFRLGNNAGASFLNGDFSEFIWYSNSQLSNQNGIYTNLNNYYSF